MKAFMFSVLIVGYVLNAYYLAADPVIKKYNTVSKIGLVIVPIGSIMGYVYILDKTQAINRLEFKKQEGEYSAISG